MTARAMGLMFAFIFHVGGVFIRGVSQELEKICMDIHTLMDL